VLHLLKELYRCLLVVLYVKDGIESDLEQVVTFL